VRAGGQPSRSYGFSGRHINKHSEVGHRFVAAVVLHPAMPRPSKRAKASSSEQTAQSSLPREIITDLPSELLLDIVSRIPTMSIVDDLCSNPGYLPLAYRERSASLRALSQTCKTLRKLCLPLAWETLEACTTTGPPNMFYMAVGDSLERKCNGLMESEYLLPYVRCVFATKLSSVRMTFNILLANTYQNRDGITHPL
jgi:hypothetical protein